MNNRYLIWLFTGLILLLVPFGYYMKHTGTGDEIFYLKYASSVADKGLPEIRNIYNEYMADKGSWIFPNPLRIGSICISALWCKVFGKSYLALASLSYLAFLLSVLLNFIYSAKFFGKEKATLLAFLVGFSPINLAMAKRALSDSLASLFIYATIWLFLDIILRDRALYKKILFVALFSFSILIKEPYAIMGLPFLIFMFVYNKKFKGNVQVSDYLYILIYPAIAVLAVYFISLGSLARVLDIVRAVGTAVKTNEYAVMYGQGPWFRYLIDYMLLSPWTLLLATGYLFVLLTKTCKMEASELFFLIISVLLFLIMNGVTKNVRYVMVLDLPIRLFSVLMLFKIFDVRFPQKTLKFATICVLAICLLDVINFQYLFIEKGIYDPLSYFILKAKHFIP